MWTLINETYEPATGMKVNVDKTEGLRCGRLKASIFDREATSHNYNTHNNETLLSISVGRGYGIKWCKRGEYIISLGVPIGWDFSWWRAFWCAACEARWKLVFHTLHLFKVIAQFCFNVVFRLSSRLPSRLSSVFHRPSHASFFTLLSLFLPSFPRVTRERRTPGCTSFAQETARAGQSCPDSSGSDPP